MITQKTYTDPTGTKKTGYIKDGVTYTDKSLTSRIPDGSVVDTAGGTYFKDSGSPYGVKIDAATGNEDSYSLYGKAYKTHYGSGGSSYMDEGLTTKVPFGTTMNKGGSQYYNDRNLGQVPTVGGALNDYRNSASGLESYLKDALSAQVNANNVATEQRIRALESREAEVNRAKEQADRESYSAYLRAINPYGAGAQQVARLGLSGSGFAESNIARLGSTYQQALAGNEQAKIDALSELSRLTDEARAEGNRQQYNLYANMYRDLYNGKIRQAENEAQFSMQAANMLNNSQIREQEYAREDAAEALRIQMNKVDNQRSAATLIAQYLLSGALTMPQVASLLKVSESDIQALLRTLY